MRIIPILFNTEMAVAILEGRKSCTRRICKDANELTVPDMDFYDSDKRTYAVHNFADLNHTEQLSTAERTCPICPGDILYVRETWCDDRQFTHDSTPGRYFYKASEDGNFKWKPSIFMPKEAARIWLKVTNVRVERLQEITKDECIKEGIYPSNCRNCNSAFECDICPDEGYDEVDKFVEVWNSTVKKSDIDKYGWNANPWVFVIEFERIDRPEEVHKA